MTSFSSETLRTARSWLLALATGPWLLGLACSEDSEPSGVGGTSGTAGTSGGGGSAGNAAAGSGGSAGSAGTGGSAGASNPAGSGGGGGSGGLNEPDAGLNPNGGSDGGGPFTLTSPAFDNNAGCGPAVGDRDTCDLFPEENTGLPNAANVSPQIDWTGAPPGTQSFAIALHDLTFLVGQDPFTHWVAWNIPASATGLPAELPPDENGGVPDAELRQVSFQGTDAFAGSGARGNVYEFVLYALSTATFDPDSTDPDEVQDALESSDSVLGTATMRARSSPTPP